MASISASELLAGLFQDEWEARLRADPMLATWTGDTRYNDCLPDAREEVFQDRQRELQAFLDRLVAIDRGALDDTGRMNYDFFERELRLQLEDLAFATYYIPITKEAGIPAGLPDLVNITPFHTVTDYENYIRRLEGFSAVADGLIALMRTGAEKGYLPARSAMAGVVHAFRAHTLSDVEQIVFYQPFQSFRAGIPPEEQTRLAGSGRAAILGSIVPGYARLADFIEQEYLPKTSVDAATLQIPAGKAFYEFCVRRFTSTNLSPQEIHDIGLAEVARIKVEMQQVMDTLGFQGPLRDFAASLRSEARFLVDTPEQLMKEVAYLMKRIEGQLPGLFKTLPRTPFGMREIPANTAPTSTTAYYFLPSGDGTTAGFYYVNTYDLKSRPLYEYEALSMHEAVPGHHLQLALQLELKNVPEFRKWGETTAFVEGWALYSERLGLEMGFYQTPYANFGRLTYEMWRAVRLVVDTGMHYFGWSRQQAIDFLAENTALSLLNITNEVDRYIAWPGQAVAYKIGELKIRELRKRAEKALGPRFNLREFHDALLLNGAIPLNVLEEKIEAWINDTALAPSA